MSRIDELVAELCPAGVPCKELGEVGTFVRGSGLQKKDFVDDGFPCIHYGQIYTFYGTSTCVTKSFISPELAARLKQAETGDLVITTTSENIEDVCTAVAWLGDGPIAIGGHSCVFKHTLDPIYAAYYFQTEQFEVQKRKFVTGTKVKDIKISDIARVKIPVPPLAIQREIVRILQHFTELDAILSAEREIRRAQRMELARRLIVTAGHGTTSRSGVERVRLGDIATQSVEPLRVKPDLTYTNLGVRWYGEGAFARAPRVGSSIKGTTLYRVKPGQLIYNRMFVTEGSFALISDDLSGGVVSNEFPVYDLDRSRVLPQWLMLYLLDEYSLKRIEAETTGTERGTMKSRRRWKEQQFEAFEIDLPPMEVQRRAARALGAVRSLEAVIREEQAARQTQYQYYCDRLLTFEELTA
ncbi:restriction endonuclease subunit S [Pedococcus sp. 2YAF34]|uniref:restriction endonuclease subunit S n=1 Tax=Pedococcus sp. 2YAF34 TaxID=3233032 RepID=UPI003F9B1E49